jgi:hypothetical protein
VGKKEKYKKENIAMELMELTLVGIIQGQLAI